MRSQTLPIREACVRLFAATPLSKTLCPCLERGHAGQRPTRPGGRDASRRQARVSGGDRELRRAALPEGEQHTVVHGQTVA